MLRYEAECVAFPQQCTKTDGLRRYMEDDANPADQGFLSGRLSVVKKKKIDLMDTFVLIFMQNTYVLPLHAQRITQMKV